MFLDPLSRQQRARDLPDARRETIVNQAIVDNGGAAGVPAQIGRMYDRYLDTVHETILVYP